MHFWENQLIRSLIFTPLHSSSPVFNPSGLVLQYVLLLCFNLTMVDHPSFVYRTRDKRHIFQTCCYHNGDATVITLQVLFFRAYAITPRSDGQAHGFR